MDLRVCDTAVGKWIPQWIMDGPWMMDGCHKRLLTASGRKATSVQDFPSAEKGGRLIFTSAGSELPEWSLKANMIVDAFMSIFISN